jgi:aspartate aminotransferase-like enzyme
MTLVTYSRALEEKMLARPVAPRTSYLDLLQLQAYWGPERLNHHTAPTSLVYGLREALRLVVDEGLEERWARHAGVATLLRDGLAALGLTPQGGPLVWSVRPPEAPALRRRLLDEFGVYIGERPDGAWLIGLLGADARPASARSVLAALATVLQA